MSNQNKEKTVPPIIAKAAKKYVDIRSNMGINMSKLYNWIDYIKSNYLKAIVGFLFILFITTIFYVYFYNPFRILSIAPILFSLVVVSVFMILVLTLTSLFDKNSKLSIIFQYKWKLIQQFGVFIGSFLVLMFGYYISKKILLFSKGKSITLVVCLFILMMAFVYSINKNIVDNFGIFKDLLFLIPCFLVDGWNWLTNDIKQAPSSTKILILLISIILLFYYIIPIVIKWSKSNKNRFNLLDKPMNLDSEVLFLTNEKLNKLQIENQPYIQKKLGEQAQKMQKNMKDTQSDSSISSMYNTLEDTVVFDGKTYANNNLDFTIVKDLSSCILADVSCDNSYVSCVQSDGTKEQILNSNNMYQKCISSKDGSIFSNLFKSNNDVLTMYDTSKNETTMDNYCANELSSNNYTLSCMNYNDVSNDIVSSDFVEDNETYLMNKQLMMCEQDDKYTLIHGYNDVCSNEVAFQCNNTTNIDSSTLETNYTTTYTKKASNVLGKKKKKIEGFLSTYNEKLHRLDYNIQHQNFTTLLSPYEKTVIETSIANDDSNFSNKLKQLNDPEEIKTLYLQYLTNNNSYNTIMTKIHEINQKASTYINQKTSYLIDTINRINNISDYNYHYGLSFWIYFDPEIMNMDVEEKQGFILDYGNTPYMYYDYNKQELIVELSKYKKINNVEQNESVIIYSTKDILFQRWNHFVINYDYGTLDMFINNNLVFTEVNVSPYIKTGKNNIQFGSNDKPLTNCGICSIYYYQIPLSLNEIQNIYRKKEHPCK